LADCQRTFKEVILRNVQFSFTQLPLAGVARKESVMMMKVTEHRLFAMRHMDFQSIALPTELLHQVYIFKTNLPLGDSWNVTTNSSYRLILPQRFKNRGKLILNMLLLKIKPWNMT